MATVLLIEDEDDTRELLGRALERAGHRCVQAADARAAVAAARAEQVELVITDVVLHGDDRAGLRVMGELREAGVRAPVVIMTAFADVEKVKTALNQGAAHFIEKPFSASDLVEISARVLMERTPAASPDADSTFLRNAGLTAKEQRVAEYLLQGLSSTEIAEREGNSPKTIRQHVSEVYAKCGVSTRAQFFRLLYRSRGL